MSSSTTTLGPDSRPNLGALAVIRLSFAYTVATNGLVLAPFIVTAVMLRFQLGESAATEIAGVEILGIALSCAVFPRWISRSAKRLVAAGALGTICGQALSACASSVWMLVVARGIAGIFEGVLFVIVASGISQRVSADRLWGHVNLLAGGINGSLLVAVSLLPLAWLGKWLFAMLAGLVILLTPQIARTEQFAARRSDRQNKPIARVPWNVIAAIWTVTVLIYGVQASQWAVAGIVGARIGLSPSSVGTLLSLSSLLGFAGALIPAQRCSRRHRLMIIWLAQIVLIASIIGFFGSTGGKSYFLSQLALNCALFAVIPFLTGLLSDIDPDGSLVSRTVVVTFVAAGIGTALAGGLFNYYGGKQFSYFLSIGLGLAFPFVWSALRGANRYTSNAQAQTQVLSQ